MIYVFLGASGHFRCWRLYSVDLEDEAPEVYRSHPRSTEGVTSVPISISPVLQYSEELMLVLGLDVTPYGVSNGETHPSMVM
jgi:hypothetical protein